MDVNELHVKPIVIATAASLLVSCMAGSPAELPARTPAEREVKAIGEEYFDQLLEESVFLRFKHGLPITGFPDLTEEAARESADSASGLLGRLRALPQDELQDHEWWLSAELLRWDLELAVTAPRYYWLEFSVTPYIAGQYLALIHQVFATRPAETRVDRELYLGLLDQYAKILQQTADKLDGQRQRGIFLARAQVPNVRRLFEGFRSRAGTMLTVAGNRLGDSLSPADGAAFAEQVSNRISGAVEPGFDRIIALLGDTYLAAAPDAVGLGVYPGGGELYRHLVRMHTTSDLTPEQIHLLGIEQVVGLEQAMADVRQELGFEGTRAEFHDMLARDPRFLAKTPADVEARYMSHLRRIEPRVSEFFSRTPAAPYGVRRLDPASEGSMTFGYYQPPSRNNPTGEYRYNGSDLEDRSLFTAASLIYHELVPGHHFQIALQFERTDLPQFRREAGYSAFTEGWAEYAADVAGEMGLYEDPYDRYGRLAMEMFIAVRLVVDTGMNALDWSLEEARTYMRAHVLQSDAEIATELLRYSADLQGQALGYRLGCLKMHELRSKAEQALGDRFDVRAFHQAAIGSGAMPLTVLEKHIDWFIDQELENSGPVAPDS